MPKMKPLTNAQVRELAECMTFELGIDPDEDDWEEEVEDCVRQLERALGFWGYRGVNARAEAARA